MTAGAAPTPSVLAAMSSIGFSVTHTYGLSETYGPSTVCTWEPEWDLLPADERARLHARQGVRYIGLEWLVSLRNPKANAEAFENGWFHSGA
jgi:acetate/butyrate---CoA ligase